MLAIKQNKAFFQHGVSNTTEELSFEPMLSTNAEHKEIFTEHGASAAKNK